MLLDEQVFFALFVDVLFDGRVNILVAVQDYLFDPNVLLHVSISHLLQIGIVDPIARQV